MESRSIMKKTNIIEKTAAVVFAMIFCVALLGACSSKKVPNVSNLAFTESGLTWDENQSAEYYVVSNGEREVTVKGNSVEFSDILSLPGKYGVSVYAVKGGERGEAATADVDVLYPAAPIIGMSDLSQDGKSISFVWNAAAEISRYNYSLYDGNGEVSVQAENGRCSVEIPSAKKQLIRVSTDGTVKDGVYYLPQSTVYEYRLDKVHNIIDYKYVFTGSGVWMEVSPDKCRMTLEVDLPDGTYKDGITFCYYALYDNEEKLGGLGMWGRRIAFNENAGKNIAWISTEKADSVDCLTYYVPEPDELVEYTFGAADIPITVTDGAVTVWCLDFELNEMVIFAELRYNGNNVLK